MEDCMVDTITMVMVNIIIPNSNIIISSSSKRGTSGRSAEDGRRNVAQVSHSKDAFMSCVCCFDVMIIPSLFCVFFFILCLLSCCAQLPTCSERWNEEN